MQVVEQSEGWRRDGERCGRRHRVTPGEGVGHDIRSSQLELHPEVEFKKLACPLMLWNYGQALVEEELEAKVVGADDEQMALEVRPPVPHGLDQAD
jgi:hypothetical protein